MTLGQLQLEKAVKSKKMNGNENVSITHRKFQTSDAGDEICFEKDPCQNLEITSQGKELIQSSKATSKKNLPIGTVIDAVHNDAYCHDAAAVRHRQTTLLPAVSCCCQCQLVVYL